MKRAAALIGILVMGFSVAPAMANTIVGQPAGPDPFYFTFDENGNGSVAEWNFGTSSYDPATPLIGGLVADPSNGGSPALRYVLPEVVGEGDIFVYDSHGLSDILRFTDSLGGLTGIGNLMFFYSQPGGGDLADTGFPSNAGTNSSPVYEDAAGNFSILNGNLNTNYVGLSSEVPEPMSLMLLGTGVVGIFRARRKLTGSSF